MITKTQDMCKNIIGEVNEDVMNDVLNKVVKK